MTIGENIYYEASTNTLSFTDIGKDELHTVNLTEGPSSHKVIPNLILRPHKTVDLLHDSDIWLCGGKYGFGIMDKKTAKSKYIARFPAEWPYLEGQICNDGAVDSEGRFWVGTMADPLDFTKFEGSVWRLDSDLSVHEIIKGGIGISNGISWSLDNKVMYYTDSLKMNIVAFDFNAATGEITNQRVFYEQPQTEGEAPAVPDGHAMDVEGYIWAAIYGGSKVVRLSPEGRVVAEIALPTRNITDVAFVGEDVFITCAADHEADTYPKSAENSGHLFRCHVGIKGYPLNKFRLTKDKIGTEEVKL